VLASLDITVERVRAQVVRLVGSGDEFTAGQVPFTPRAKRVLELALHEALSHGHNYIGTEHILLGLVRENNGVAARILLDFDADSEKVRGEVVRLLPELATTRDGLPPEPAHQGLVEVLGHALARAGREARRDGRAADSGDLLLALCARDDLTKAVLADLGVSGDGLRRAVDQARRR
jgi:ATP-dependent Clp protease ATP-binding subunit ClpA